MYAISVFALCVSAIIVGVTLLNLGHDKVAVSAALLTCVLALSTPETPSFPRLSPLVSGARENCLTRSVPPPRAQMRRKLFASTVLYTVNMSCATLQGAHPPLAAAMILHCVCVRDLPSAFSPFASSFGRLTGALAPSAVCAYSSRASASRALCAAYTSRGCSASFCIPRALQARRPPPPLPPAKSAQASKSASGTQVLHHPAPLRSPTIQLPFELMAALSFFQHLFVAAIRAAAHFADSDGCRGGGLRAAAAAAPGVLLEHTFQWIAVQVLVSLYTARMEEGSAAPRSLRHVCAPLR